MKFDKFHRKGKLSVFINKIKYNHTLQLKTKLV